MTQRILYFPILFSTLCFGSIGLAGAKLAPPNREAKQIDSNSLFQGAGAFVCREQHGQIRWIRLVDLFEAEHEFELQPTAFEGDRNQIINTVDRRLRYLFDIKALNLYSYLSRLNYLENGTEKMVLTTSKLEIIESPENLYHVLPSSLSDCLNGHFRYEQIANTQRDGTIIIQKELLHALSPVEQAAVVLHEAIAAQYRDSLGVNVFTQVRRITGLLFSKVSDIALVAEINFSISTIRTKLTDLLPKIPTPSSPNSEGKSAGIQSGLVVPNWKVALPFFKSEWPIMRGKFGTDTPRPDYFIAIAYNYTTTKVGLSIDPVTTGAEAANIALAEAGDGAILIASTKSPCLAFGLDSENPWKNGFQHSANSRRQAEDSFNVACEKKYDHSCWLVASICRSEIW